MQTQLSALAKRVGISRLANLTGLDRLGLPVVAAIRPLSRNLTVSFGKGFTLEQAQCSAVMEAAELYFSEKPCGALLTATFQELPARAALNPSLLQQDGINADLASEVFEWVEGRDILTGKPMMVPWQALSMDYTEEARRTPKKIRFGATGLAAGFEERQAVLHGIYEVIERDCHNIWNELNDEPRIATLVDQSSLRDDTVMRLLQTIRSADLEVLIWELTDHRRIPCYLAEVVDLKPHATTAFAQGAAASLCSMTALRKALLEAIQIRLTYIAGNRDDLDWSDYGTRYDDVVESRRWLLKNIAARRVLRPESTNFETPRSELAEVLQRLHAAGIEEVIVTRLSLPEDDAAVVKVIIPHVSDIPDANHYDDMRRKRIPEYA